MLAKAWHWLLVGGLGLAVVAATGCSSDDPGDDDDDGGTSGTGGSAPAAGQGGGAGTAAAGKGGTGGTATAGTGGTTAASGGAAGSAGSSATGGTAGGAVGGAGGTPGTGGSAGSDGGLGGTSGGAGDTGGGGATAGSGGGGMPATLIEPIQRNGNYVLEFGDIYFEVNAAVGARIVDLHLTGATNAANILGGSSATDNYGSTFWPAPQTWEWPPTDSIGEINSGAYTATVASPSVTMVGQPNAASGLSVTKKFTADLAKQTIVVDYTMTANMAGISVAPWEITRTFKRGIRFYPTGSTAPVAGGTFPVVPTTTGAGCTWHQAPSAAGEDQKMLADGGAGGWLAHVDGDVLLVKKFTDIPAAQAAPNEGEVEIYVSGASDYIELEQQGAYGPIAMGESKTWTVTWYVRKLPADIMPTVGNQALVDYVTSLFQ